MRCTVYCDGYYSDVKRGISLGCPPSPLMGALYLKQLDDRMEKTGLFYARYMDDWTVIAPTRWKLRSAVRIVNATLNLLKVEQHPDILKPVWFLAFQKTKSWLQLSPDWKAPRTFPGLESAEDFTRAKLFLDYSENNFEMSTKRLLVE